MLERRFDSERINEIANDPSVFPLICGYRTAPFDLTPITSDENNVCLVGKHGYVLFIRMQPGIYEFHTSVLPEGRGRWMIDGSQEAFYYMFTKTDAFELLTKCPDGNLASKVGAKAVGCLPVFRTRPNWPIDGKLMCVDVYSIIIQNWIKNANGLVESGKWFHNNLEEQYKKLNKSLEIHEEDGTHDRYVGLAAELLRSGHIVKAISLYNRWAFLAGYKQINVVSLKPLIIDISDCQLLIKKDGFKVL